MKRALTQRLMPDRDTSFQLAKASRLCARARTLAMQQWRRADADAVTIIPDDPPKKKSGKIDWIALFGERPQLSAYKLLCRVFPQLGRGVISAIDMECRQLYCADRFDILVGKRRTREWRDDAPIPIRGADAKIVPCRDGWAVQFTPWSMKHNGKAGRIVIPLRAARDRLPARFVGVLDNYASGTVKLPRLLIHDAGKRGKRKWLVDIPFDVCLQETSGLRADRTLQVARPQEFGFLRCTLPCKNGPPRHQDMEYQSALPIGERNEIIRRSMQHKYRCASEPSARKGHGRKRAVESFNKLTTKRVAQQKAFNHNAARTILNIALRWKCANIEFENLSSAKLPRESLVLGAWPYHQLKNRLSQLCEEHGIEIKIVKPIEEITEDDTSSDGIVASG